MQGTTCHRGHPKSDRTKQGACRLCLNMKVQEGRLRNPEKYLHATQKYSWKQYGIVDFTPVDYDRLYQIQQGKCAVCKKHSSEFQRRLAVDHNHKTGKVRGLLCGSCNTRLGWFEDQEFTQRALKYLEEQN
jgi:hypothetical protein